MLKPRQPGRNAHFTLTQDGGPEFGVLSPNVAVEPSNTPGMVRIYRRATPSAPWRQGSQIAAGQAAVLYGFVTRPDSSD